MAWLFCHIGISCGACKRYRRLMACHPNFHPHRLTSMRTFTIASTFMGVSARCQSRRDELGIFVYYQQTFIRGAICSAMDKGIEGRWHFVLSTTNNIEVSRSSEEMLMSTSSVIDEK